jgi:hypothetical protein
MRLASLPRPPIVRAALGRFRCRAPDFLGYPKG